MNYIEMSKICESCREVNNACGIDYEQCKKCKNLNQQEKIRMGNSFYMKDIYEIVDNALVELELDGEDLLIRIPYLPSDEEDIIKIMKSRGDNNE